ncbi:MAG: hypothetical protein KBD12_00535 [Candidatus Pacebacteria bacterium]|nr:hypothetical protein [Candidatus Paceibacterota bacterium]
MAYIPTIHTFEDDLNENKGYGEVQNTLGVEPVISKENILIPEKEGSSIGKKIFILFSVLFLIGGISVVGYYYYTNYQNKQAEEALNAESLAKKQEEIAREQATVVNNLKAILPSLANDIGQYTNSTIKKDGVIIITIKENTNNGVDNYSQLYAYILAHQKEMSRDLIDTFNLNELSENMAVYEDTNKNYSNNTDDESSDSAASSSDTKIKEKDKTSKVATNTLSSVINLFDPTSLQDNFNTLITNMTTPTPISGEDLVWESKTLNNQDFQIANAGVVTLIYGYAKQNYLVFSLSLKDFFDAIKSLK